jgi:outer membrane protein, heavy metal efflux system
MLKIMSDRKQKIKFKRFWIAAIIIVALNLNAFADITSNIKADSTSDSLSMEQVISDVLKNNDRLAAARLMEKSSQENARAAGKWDDPMLMLGVQNIPTSSWKLNQDDMTMRMAGLSWAIPYAGEKGLQAKAAKSEASAATAAREMTTLDLITAAKMAYYDLYYRDKYLDDLKTQHELMSEVAKAAMARLQTNQGGQEEVLAAQSNVWRLETEMLDAQHEIDDAIFSLNNLRGKKIISSEPRLETPVFSALPQDISGWVDTAFSNYPELRRLESQSKSYGFSSAASRRMRWPMLSLSTQYGYRQGYGMMGPRDNMVSFGANISLPIFSHSKEGAMARSMDLMRRSTEAQTSQLRRDIESGVATLYQTAWSYSEKIEIYKNKIIPASEQAYQSAYAGYINNRIDFSSLLNYAADLYRDKTTTTLLSLDYARTMAEIEKYTADTTVFKVENIQKDR